MIKGVAQPRDSFEIVVGMKIDSEGSWILKRSAIQRFCKIIHACVSAESNSHCKMYLKSVSRSAQSPSEERR
jgi:hypothetical protein